MQLPGFEAIEGPEEDEIDKPSTSTDKPSTTYKITDEDLNKYLQNKESIDILQKCNLQLPSAYFLQDKTVEEMQEDYNKAETKMNEIKNKMWDQLIFF